MSAAVGARPSLISCDDVTVAFGAGDARVTALDRVALSIESGERLALWGRSGSGKTTLLHVLGGLIVPSQGGVKWRERDLSSLDDAARGRARRALGIAYVFQGSNLLTHFTAFENVAFAKEAGEGPPGGSSSRSEHSPQQLLELVGLSAKLDALPGELSGGEAQRVAVARALAQSPELLLCDEPTGHLDSDTAERVLDMIDALQREFGFALVTATHDADVAARAERIVELRDGRAAESVTS